MCDRGTVSFTFCLPQPQPCPPRTSHGVLRPAAKTIGRCAAEGRCRSRSAFLSHNHVHHALATVCFSRIHPHFLLTVNPNMDFAPITPFIPRRIVPQ
ncbi:hypothetical protein SESBI_41127 [Sesbania bispinosa]|nr:hypothetical protein SESBI_41127 [Sesbania bispinosa]